MTRDDDPVRIPDLVLERFRLGELPSAESEAVARRARDDEGVRQRLEALTASDEDLRRLHPPKQLAHVVRARLAGREARPRSLSGRRPWLLALSMAAAMVLVAPRILELTRPEPRVASPEPGERIKGRKPGLALFRKTGDRSEALADGDVVRPGDLIRVGYRPAGRRFGAILSLDGRGHVTVHLPTSGRQAASLRAGDVVLLDHSFELDDAPRWERFFFVTSETPFSIAPLVEGARHAGAGSAPPSALRITPPLEQTAFSLEKEMRP